MNLQHPYYEYVSRVGGNVISKGTGGVVRPGSEPVKSKSELDKAEETTSCYKKEVNFNIESISIDVGALGAAAKPNIAPKGYPDDDDETELTGEEVRLFRGVAARLNYVGPDRPDMQFAAKEAARLMSSPGRCDRRILRNIGRYLIRRPRISLIFGWQCRPSQMDGYSGSDWAGCSRSRKSTS